MALAEDVLEEIAVLVRCGFSTRDDLMTIVSEEMHAPGELSAAEVGAAIDDELRAHAEDQATWPAVTDCDRLAGAFAALATRGIIALENAGMTQSDGHDDFREAHANAADPSSIVGYCFFHGQDLRRAVRGGGLYLAFGPVDPKDEATKGREVGRIVQEELARAGLTVAWDGTFAQRIHLPHFVWRRRA
jgi:hypothetical protein